ncbi:MAG: hypothetical protein IT289_07535 [Oligoflexia bacterium]|nr:hypothetical protein [Oligoflexia bacterium]
MDEFDSWSVHVNDSAQTGMFFDNDHYIALGLVRAGGLECTNCPMNYEFSGNDDGVVEDFRMSVYPDGKVEGLLIVNPESVERQEYPMICLKMKEKDANQISWSEAEEALRNASKNGGSTRF